MKKFYKYIQLRCTLPVLCLLMVYAGGYAAAASPGDYQVNPGDENISGKILAYVSKEPLAGVNIIIKGTLNGTISDVDGNFSILAAPDDTLVFSFIGYEVREVPLEGRTRLELELMEDIGILSELEIVSTGYQQLPKERATGAFVQLDTEIINRSTGTGILERMEDITSGLIFNRNGPVGDELSIRGRSTLFANSQPLIVVDNFPYDGDIRYINPNDVESITLLKDAAAASIWGARAGNGVIVITTKKGAYKQAPEISLNANVTLGESPDPFYNPQMSVADFVDVEQMLFEQGYYAATESSPANQPLSPVVELLIAKRDGEISNAAAAERLAKLPTHDIRNDYEKYLYQESLLQQYALQARGGAKQHRYLVSAGYDRNRENRVGNSFERITLHGRNTFSLLADKLEVTTGIYYTQNQRENNGINPGSLRMGTGSPMYPYGRLADENGNPLPIIHDYREGFVTGAAAAGLLDWRYRPLEELQIADNTSKSSDLRLNGQLSYAILPNLKAEVLYQYWSNKGEGRRLHPLESYFARDLINTYTQVDEAGNLTRAIPEGGILDLDNTESSSYNFRGQLRYEGRLGAEKGERQGGRHRLSALAGYEVRDMDIVSSYHRYYGYDDALATSSYVDYAGFYSRYNYPLFANQIPFVDDISSLTDRFISWYANAAYTYDNRYTLSLSGRRDMSNLFGVDANQRGVPLWSAGLSWNLSEEGFYKFDLLPYLRLRATYGYNGNIDKSVSAYTTARIAGSSFRTGLPYASITNPPNPDLHWEQVRIINLGMDFELKEGVLDGSVEYYRKKGIDLIGDTPFAPSTGIREFKGNYANTGGTGWDVVLNSLNINKAFQWRSNLLFSFIKEEVTNYKAEENAGSYLTYGSGQMGLAVPMEGKPLFALYSYPWAGLDPDTGAPRGFLDGEVSTEYKEIRDATTPESLVYHGPARPVAFGALRNSFSWKGFSLSVNISYRLGYYFRKNSIRYSSVLTAQGGHSDYALRWQQPRDEASTQVPSMPESPDINRDNLYTYSEILVEKGDHIRLRDINLSYTFSREHFPRLPFASLQLYAYAANLGILWKATDAVKDPDYQNMPQLRSMSVGLRVDF